MNQNNDLYFHVLIERNARYFIHEAIPDTKKNLFEKTSIQLNKGLLCLNKNQVSTNKK